MGVILMGLAVFGSIQTISYIAGPSLCGDCHGNIYQNYTAAGRGSIMQPHANKSITCLLCHSGVGEMARIDALKTVSEAEIVKKLSPQLNRLFQTNSSFEVNLNASRFTGLRANCTKCHSTLNGEMHENRTECSLCHFAHKRQNMNLEAPGAVTHKNVKCPVCHGTDSEMQIPSCTKCHTPHAKQTGSNNTGCLECHNDAHVPTRKITFSESTSKEWCSGCHINEYRNLTASGGGHNKLPSCSSCHPVHGTYKSCFECHGIISDDDSAKHIVHRGNTCNLCHIRKGGGKGSKLSCQDCHDPHNPMRDLPKPATNQQIGNIARQLARNLT